MRRPLLPLALALVLLPVLAWSDAESVTFRFAPPDGTTFVQTLVTTKTTEIGSQKQTDVTRSKVRLRFEKKPQGFLLTGTPLSMTLERNGQAVENPLLDVLSQTVITYRIDPQGKLVAIQGYGDFQDRLFKALPPQAARALSKVVNEEGMVAREKAEWAGRIGDFSGNTLELGASWTATSPFDLPSGEQIQFYTRTDLVGKEKCGARDCVRIRFRYDTDAAALGAVAGKVVQEVAGAPVKVGKMGLSGSGERLVDPNTLLVHAETLERTITLEGGTTVREKREYSFEFEPRRAGR
jgi:hypothetical protein